MKQAIAAFVVSCLFALSAFGQVPKTVAQVPAYPGATLVSSEQQPTEAELAAGKAPDFVLAAEKVWSCAESADQVARFYAGKLGAAIGQEGGGEVNDLAPGQATAVGSSVEYYDPGFLDESSDRVRAGFAKRPKLSAEEGWARSASFSWAYKSPGEDAYAFSLSIVDTSLSEEDPARYAQGTEIRLSARMMNQKKLAAMLAGNPGDADAYKKAQEGQEAWGEDMKRKSDEIDANISAKNAALDAIFAKTPTEAQLGVPLFPGAAYDKDESILRSGGSTERGRCYAYFAKSSGDVRGTIEDVTRFYEQKTKRKRLDLPSKDMSRIPFAFYPPKQKGDKPAIKDEIVVGYNGANGMISIWIYKDEELNQAGGR